MITPQEDPAVLAWAGDQRIFVPCHPQQGHVTPCDVRLACPDAVEARRGRPWPLVHELRNVRVGLLDLVGILSDIDCVQTEDDRLLDRVDTPLDAVEDRLDTINESLDEEVDAIEECKAA